MIIKNLQTTGVDVQVKRMNIGGGSTATSVELFLLDCAGSPLYSTMLPECWPSTTSVDNVVPCLVYDTTDKASFDAIRMWWDRLQSAITDTGSIRGLLIGTKVDLINRRFVLQTIAADFANKHRLLFYETSSVCTVVLPLAMRCPKYKWFLVFRKITPMYKRRSRR